MRLLTISGKMLAGKDTVADLIAQRLDRPARVVFSDLICVEARRGVQAMRQHIGDPMVQADWVSVVLGLEPAHAREFVRLLSLDAANPTFDVRDRTPATRVVLQQLGSRWRPDGYWATRVYQHCDRLTRLGHTVILSGVRYPNEYDLFRDGGAFMVRLDVSPEEQQRRGLVRDGHPPHTRALEHSGEVALDHHRFDLRIDTNQFDARQVADLVWAAWQPHLPQSAGTKGPTHANVG